MGWLKARARSGQNNDDLPAGYRISIIRINPVSADVLIIITDRRTVRRIGKIS
jgi:hypothetical protein